ncbi:TetR/AcrR family transcriptional regulator [Bacteroides sp. 214]|uniref:TetR/AcrR family transcriptional regulator n=1 Tax=Bacteroides sp. 214 TaxID=2302935 RepID=UPI0013D37A51|nr:TetR family transcriptional regulator [Bacteroides sp. 214]NDW12535.1 TetR/AcrR family transcriptional regulator [Bacteroides sp. 214]
MVKRYSTSDVSERILDAARELFITKGYDGTSIRDIASASGANVAHIKYYFQSKSNLFEIIFDEAFEILIKKVFSTLDSDMPFFELVESWINIYYELLPEYPQIPMFVLNAINHSPDALMEKISKHNPERIFNRLNERFEAEAAKGTIKNMPFVDFGLNVLSLCVFPFIFKGLALQIANKSNADYVEILEGHKKYVIDFVFSGLKI